MKLFQQKRYNTPSPKTSIDISYDSTPKLNQSLSMDKLINPHLTLSKRFYYRILEKFGIVITDDVTQHTPQIIHLNQILMVSSFFIDINKEYQSSSERLILHLMKFVIQFILGGVPPKLTLNDDGLNRDKIQKFLIDTRDHFSQKQTRSLKKIQRIIREITEQTFEEEGFSDDNESNRIQGPATNQYLVSWYNNKKDENKENDHKIQELNAQLRLNEQKISELQEKVRIRDENLNNMTIGYLKDLQNFREQLFRKNNQGQSEFEVSYFDASQVVDESLRALLNDKINWLKQQYEKQITDLVVRVKDIIDKKAEEHETKIQQIQAPTSQTINWATLTFKEILHKAFTKEKNQYEVWKAISEIKGNKFLLDVLVYQQNHIGINYKEINKILAQSPVEQKNIQIFKKQLMAQVGEICLDLRRETVSLKEERNNLRLLLENQRVEFEQILKDQIAKSTYLMKNNFQSKEDEECYDFEQLYLLTNQEKTLYQNLNRQYERRISFLEIEISYIMDYLVRMKREEKRHYIKYDLLNQNLKVLCGVIIPSLGSLNNMEELDLNDENNELIQQFLNKLKEAPQLTRMIMAHQADFVDQTQKLLNASFDEIGIQNEQACQTDFSNTMEFLEDFSEKNQQDLNRFKINGNFWEVILNERQSLKIETPSLLKQYNKECQTEQQLFINIIPQVFDKSLCPNCSELSKSLSEEKSKKFRPISCYPSEFKQEKEITLQIPNFNEYLLSQNGDLGSFIPSQNQKSLVATPYQTILPACRSQSYGLPSRTTRIQRNRAISFDQDKQDKEAQREDQNSRATRLFRDLESERKIKAKQFQETSYDAYRVHLKKAYGQFKVQDMIKNSINVIEAKKKEQKLKWKTPRSQSREPPISSKEYINQTIIKRHKEFLENFQKAQKK